MPHVGFVFTVRSQILTLLLTVNTLLLTWNLVWLGLGRFEVE